MKRRAPINAWFDNGRKQNDSSNKYLQELRPVFHLLRLFGRFPLSFTNDGQVRWKLLSWPFLYSVIVSILQLYATIIVVMSLFSELFIAKNYDGTVYRIALSVSLFQSFSTPFTYWWESPKFVKYLEMWCNFQEDFGSDEMVLHYTKTSRILSLLEIPISFGLILLEVNMFLDPLILKIYSYTSAYGSMVISLIFWCVTHYELQYISENLLKRIIANGCRDMSKYRIMWLKLSSLVFSVGDTVGQIGLSICVQLFIVFVLTTYGLLTMLVDLLVAPPFLGLFFTFTLGLSCQFLVCDVAHVTTQLTGHHFSTQLLQVDVSELSEKDQFEMSLLLQTMAANPPEVNFKGFTKINRGLFVTFVTEAVTYLVVLIQLKTSDLAMKMNNSTLLS